MAETITEREKRDCQRDYHKYCSEYGLGTEALRACMSRNIKKISNVCVGALVDAGEMTQSPSQQAAGSQRASTRRQKEDHHTRSRHKKVTTQELGRSD